MSEPYVPKLNILVAIPYCKPDVVAALNQEKRLRFYLDSGAFTAWKAKKEITLDQYCGFIAALKIKPWRYFTLDVIGNSIKTRENFDELKRRSFSPVPIFTRGEKIEELEYYYSQSDCVALGGLVHTMGSRGFVKGLMTQIGDRKVHWLGFCDRNFVSYYRPYSCDSSEYSVSSRFAELRMYCGSGKWIYLKKSDFQKKPSLDVMKQFEIYGEDPRQLAFEGEWKNKKDGSASETVTCKSWVRFSMDLEKKLGTKYFIACGSASAITNMSRAFAYWASKEEPTT